MIKFLNTELLIEEILDLFETAEKEVLIVVPFIKTSRIVESALKEIDKKGIELTIICRVEELEIPIKRLLNGLVNLNLFSHPNVHAKCYFNESKLIITSLNMTAHSELNNREMGVLIQDDVEDDNEDYWNYELDYLDDDEDGGYVGEKFYDDYKTEVQKILNASKFVKKSKRSNEIGFTSRLLRTTDDEIKAIEEMLNKFFSPKRFRYSNERGYYDPFICENFIDKFDLLIKDINERLELIPNKGDERIWYNKLKHLHRKVDRYEIEGKSYYFHYT